MRHDATTNDRDSIDGWLREAAFVRALARDLVATAADVDDLVQETWLRATRRAPARGFSLRAWLAGLVRNVAREQRRASERRAQHEEAAALAHGDAPAFADPSANDPARLAERLELVRRALAEVAALDDASRAVVLAHYLDGRTLEEIARGRGEPAATTRSRLKRALDRLRERLDATTDGGRGGWLAAFAPWDVVASPTTWPTAPPPALPAPRPASSLRTSSAAAGHAVVPVAALLLITAIAAWWWSERASSAVVEVASRAADEGAPRDDALAPPPNAPLVVPEPLRVLEPVPSTIALVTSPPAAAAAPAATADAGEGWRVVGRLVGLDPALALGADTRIEVAAVPTSPVDLVDSAIATLSARASPDPDGRFALELPRFPQPIGAPPWWEGFTVTFCDPRYVDTEQFVPTVAANGTQIAAPHDFVVELATRPAAFVAGRVVDEQGAPLADVHVHWDDWDAADDDADREVRTDEAGLFRLEAAALGAARLCASVDDPWLAEETTAERRAALPAERASLMAADVTVELRAGHETDVPDLVLRRGVAIRGRALGRDGAPLPGASIEGHARVAAPTPDQPLRELSWNRSARSGPDGCFVLAGLVAAEWTLWIEEVDGEPCHSVVNELELVGCVKVRAPAVDVELCLSTIAVELTLCLDGQPQPGLRCSIGGTSPDRRSTSWLGMSTDEAGRLRFAGAADCEFALSIDRPDLESRTPSFRLRVDESVHRRTLDLERRRPRPTLALRFTGAGAAELQRCCVTLEPADGSWPRPGEKVLRREEDGTFRWPDLDAGAWRIVAIPGAGSFGAGGCYEAESFELDLDDPVVVEREFALRPTGQLSLLVLDAAGAAVRAHCEVLPLAAGALARPVRFVWQHAMGSGSGPNTSDEGPALVAPPPPPGRYLLRFTAPGFHDAEREVTVVPFEQTEVVLALVAR